MEETLFGLYLILADRIGAVHFENFGYTQGCISYFGYYKINIEHDFRHGILGVYLMKIGKRENFERKLFFIDINLNSSSIRVASRERNYSITGDTDDVKERFEGEFERILKDFNLKPERIYN